MHMSEKHLKSSHKSGIDKLEIVSMEGRYYLARFALGGSDPTTYLLTDESDNPKLFNGASAVKEYFKRYHPASTELIPPTGTDEMVGMPSADMVQMKVKL